MVVDRSRRARTARKRKRRMAQVDHDLANSQWLALKECWAGCAYCGNREDSLERDCVLPISRGGRYTFDNVVPACRSCNSSKSNNEVTSWMRRKKLDERTFLVRHREIVGLLTQWIDDESANSDDHRVH